MTPTERDRIRRILLDALPADARWVPWVEGVLNRIEQGARAQSVEGIVLSQEEARDAAEALGIAQESVDDYADQFSDVDARLDEGKTRAAAARMRALAARLEASS